MFLSKASMAPTYFTCWFLQNELGVSISSLSRTPLLSLVWSSALIHVIIEQTYFDLHSYKDVIDDEKYEEYGGNPLEFIKKQLPLYNSICIKFALAEGNLSGIQVCLCPIDGDKSINCDPPYKQYYSTLAYTRYKLHFHT